MNNRIPLLLAMIGGYADTAGFLALHGLFSAHVTGNFVTLGASLALGTSGAVAKLLALPVFCAVVVLTALLGHALARRGAPVLLTLVGLEVVLLAAVAAQAIAVLRFPDPDSVPALATGMTLVAAMGVQNAAQRIHLPSAPPSTLMTGTSTQVMIDIANLLAGESAEAKAVALARMPRMIASVAVFALGCGAAALFFHLGGTWCFAVPPALAIAVFLLLFSGS